ncbi:MAG: glycoside hydrolase family 44 protein [Polyangiaceae bacterium]
MKKRYVAVVLVALIGCGAFALRILKHGAPLPDTGDAPESAAASARAATPFVIAETAYDGKLGVGWEDWGWGPHALGNGPAKIQFASYGGIVLHHSPLEASYGALVLRYKAPAEWEDFLTVALNGRNAKDTDFPVIAVGPELTLLVDGWREVLIDFKRLNPNGVAFDRILLTARKSVSQDPAFIDKVVLTQPGATADGAGPVRTTALGISCRAPTRRISEMIYGGTMAVWDADQSGQRIGGNPLTRLNWDADRWNSGADWFFENGQGANLKQWLGDARAHEQPVALVVPMIGWVAKDVTSVGFPKSSFPRQRKFDPNRPEAGDGFASDGSKLTPLSPTQTSVPAPPEKIGDWIRRLHEQGLDGSVNQFILDNEPALWDVNHRDVHPKPVGYDELLERTISYGSEIRKAKPDAVIAGPAEWGWASYFDSAKDRDAGAAHPDRSAHGETPLLPWYLQKLAEHEKKTGTRILDVLDVHYYPAAAGMYGAEAKTDAESAALRIRATRALWDPSYRDESWIAEPIRLIPRLKQWVLANYPGRSISLGEWSFGADEHMSGGLATAEALGRFGQQGLDSAYYWGGPKPGTASFWAFRAFRNFDGQGGRFQDLALVTKEADMLSLFASRDDANTKIVAILVNRDPASPMRARIELDGCRRVISYRAFSYAAGFDKLKQETPATKVDSASVIDTVPPYSIRVLDIRLAP